MGPLGRYFEFAGSASLQAVSEFPDTARLVFILCFIILSFYEQILMHLGGGSDPLGAPIIETIIYLVLIIHMSLLYTMAITI